MAVVYLTTNCFLAHSTETNLWSERRHTIQLAALPTPSTPLPSLPQITLPKPEFRAHPTRDLELPLQFGSIRKILKPHPQASNAQSIVHIQDIHMNAEAQKNIAAAVQELIKRKKVGVVALEGAFETIDLAPYHRPAVKPAMKTVADYLLKTNRISGPIHAGMTAKGQIPAFIGVDDQSAYNANVLAYQNSAPLKEAAQQQLLQSAKNLKEEKLRSFNPQLAIFDERVESYRAGKIQMGEYVKHINAAVMQPAPAVRHFLEALTIESSLDFNRVERERMQLLSQLTRRLSPVQVNELMAMSVSYRSGNISHADFYSQLKALCLNHGIDLARTPAMDSYIRYLLLADQIDSEQLFAELRSLEEAGYARLVKTEQEKELVQKSRRLYLTGKLVDLALTKEEWNEYQQAVLSTKYLALSTELKSFEKFYQQAEIRDQSMAKNLRDVLSSEKLESRSNYPLLNTQNVVILVTGGFHSQGIDRLLVDAGYTVISFVPKVTKVDPENGSAYLSVFSQEKTPLDQLFEGKKLFLSRHPAGFTPDSVAMLAGNTRLHQKGEVEARAAIDEADPKLAPVKFSFSGAGENTTVIGWSKGKVAASFDGENIALVQFTRTLPARVRDYLSNIKLTIVEFWNRFLVPAVSTVTPEGISFENMQLWMEGPSNGEKSLTEREAEYERRYATLALQERRKLEHNTGFHKNSFVWKTFHQLPFSANSHRWRNGSRTADRSYFLIELEIRHRALHQLIQHSSLVSDNHFKYWLISKGLDECLIAQNTIGLLEECEWDLDVVQTQNYREEYKPAIKDWGKRLKKLRRYWQDQAKEIETLESTINSKKPGLTGQSTRATAKEAGWNPDGLATETVFAADYEFLKIFYWLLHWNEFKKEHPGTWWQTLIRFAGLFAVHAAILAPPLLLLFVTPAEAGVQFLNHSLNGEFTNWIPAFAGMTAKIYYGLYLSVLATALQNPDRQFTRLEKLFVGPIYLMQFASHSVFNLVAHWFKAALTTEKQKISTVSKQIAVDWRLHIRPAGNLVILNKILSQIPGVTISLRNARDEQGEADSISDLMSLRIGEKEPFKIQIAAPEEIAAELLNIVSSMLENPYINKNWLEHDQDRIDIYQSTAERLRKQLNTTAAVELPYVQSLRSDDSQVRRAALMDLIRDKDQFSAEERGKTVDKIFEIFPELSNSESWRKAYKDDSFSKVTLLKTILALTDGDRRVFERTFETLRNFKNEQDFAVGMLLTYLRNIAQSASDAAKLIPFSQDLLEAIDPIIESSDPMISRSATHLRQVLLPEEETPFLLHPRPSEPSPFLPPQVDQEPINPMKDHPEFIPVGEGFFTVAEGEATLKSYGIWRCVVCVITDPTQAITLLAHLMPVNSLTSDSFVKMQAALLERGVDLSNVKITLLGPAQNGSIAPQKVRTEIGRFFPGVPITEDFRGTSMRHVAVRARTGEWGDLTNLLPTNDPSVIRTQAMVARLHEMMGGLDKWLNGFPLIEIPSGAESPDQAAPRSLSGKNFSLRTHALAFGIVAAVITALFSSDAYRVLLIGFAVVIFLVWGLPIGIPLFLGLFLFIISKTRWAHQDATVLDKNLETAGRLLRKGYANVQLESQDLPWYVLGTTFPKKEKKKMEKKGKEETKEREKTVVPPWLLLYGETGTLNYLRRCLLQMVLAHEAWRLHEQPTFFIYLMKLFLLVENYEPREIDVVTERSLDILDELAERGPTAFPGARSIEEAVHVTMDRVWDRAGGLFNRQDWPDLLEQRSNFGLIVIVRGDEIQQVLIPAELPPPLRDYAERRFPGKCTVVTERSQQHLTIWRQSAHGPYEKRPVKLELPAMEEAAKEFITPETSIHVVRLFAPTDQGISNVAMYHFSYHDLQRFRAGLDRQLAAARKAGKKLVLIVDGVFPRFENVRQDGRQNTPAELFAQHANPNFRRLLFRDYEMSVNENRTVNDRTEQGDFRTNDAELGQNFTAALRAWVAQEQKGDIRLIHESDKWSGHPHRDQIRQTQFNDWLSYADSFDAFMRATAQAKTNSLLTEEDRAAYIREAGEAVRNMSIIINRRNQRVIDESIFEASRPDQEVILLMGEAHYVLEPLRAKGKEYGLSIMSLEGSMPQDSELVGSQAIIRADAIGTPLSLETTNTELFRHILFGYLNGLSQMSLPIKSSNPNYDETVVRLAASAVALRWTDQQIITWLKETSNDERLRYQKLEDWVRKNGTSYELEWLTGTPSGGIMVGIVLLREAGRFIFQTLLPIFLRGILAMGTVQLSTTGEMVLTAASVFLFVSIMTYFYRNRPFQAFGWTALTSLLLEVLNKNLDHYLYPSVSLGIAYTVIIILDLAYTHIGRRYSGALHQPTIKGAEFVIAETLGTPVRLGMDSRYQPLDLIHPWELTGVEAGEILELNQAISQNPSIVVLEDQDFEDTELLLQGIGLLQIKNPNLLVVAQSKRIYDKVATFMNAGNVPLINAAGQTLFNFKTIDAAQLNTLPGTEEFYGKLAPNQPINLITELEVLNAGEIYKKVTWMDFLEAVIIEKRWGTFWLKVSSFKKTMRSA